MNDFLNPKSMLTPGAAGGVMMFIANAVTNQFPEVPFRYSALALSFLVGFVVLKAPNLVAWERPVYWVLNSLVIFSMGVGTSNIARNVTTASPRPAVSLSLFDKAYAMESRPGAAALTVNSEILRAVQATPPDLSGCKQATAISRRLTDAQKLASNVTVLNDRLAARDREIQELKQEQSSPPPTPAPPQRTSFFNRW